MDWKDLELPGGPWRGLDVRVARGDLPPGAPHFRVQAAPRFLRIACAGAPVLWASVHRFHYGLWRLLTGTASSWAVIPPIRAAELRAVPDAPHTRGWWRSWARWFARALVASPRTPLYPARWALTAPRAADAPSPAVPGPGPSDWTHMDRIHGVRACLTAPRLAWESWFVNGSGALLRAREASRPDGARVRAFRKRARDGTLPPVLTHYISGLDMFLVLDGHDRLQAALLEGAAPPLLALWQVHAIPRVPDPVRQETIVREVERKRRLAGTRERPLHQDAENALLVNAFDDRDELYPRTRAYRLPGGRAQWVVEAAQRAEVASDHPLFTGACPPA